MRLKYRETRHPFRKHSRIRKYNPALDRHFTQRGTKHRKAIIESGLRVWERMAMRRSRYRPIGHRIRAEDITDDIPKIENQDSAWRQ